MGTAVQLPFEKKDLYKGDARLYKIEPPFMASLQDSTFILVDHVVVLGNRKETWVFPARPDGVIYDLTLKASLKDVIDHERALSAGCGWVSRGRRRRMTLGRILGLVLALLLCVTGLTLSGMALGNTSTLAWVSLMSGLSLFGMGFSLVLMWKEVNHDKRR